MKKTPKIAFVFALLHTLLILLVASVPFYFYVKMAFEYSKNSQIEQLKEYANSVEERIYSIKEDKFIYPRSFLFESGVFDKDKKPIFSLLSFGLDGVEQKKGYISISRTLKPNRLDALYLVCAKRLEYEEVLKEAGVIVLFLVLALFVSNYLVIKMSIKPYQKLNKLMEEFFDDAMHELKTPLGVLKINIELLKSKIGENRNLTRANGAVTSLSIVYEDLEYLLKNKNSNYPKEKINLSHFLRDRCEQFFDLALSKNINIECRINESVYVEINRIELQRIIDNNLSNAIKYSYQDGKIEVSMVRMGECVIVKFKDFGIGIKEKGKIFERHYREDEVKGGFGIGLSIVKKICDKHGIKIEVESESGKGALFKYSFVGR